MKATLRAKLWRMLTAAGVLDEVRTGTAAMIVCKVCPSIHGAADPVCLSHRYLTDGRFATIRERCNAIDHVFVNHREHKKLDLGDWERIEIAEWLRQRVALSR